MLNLSEQLKKKENIYIKWDGNMVLINPNSKTTTLFSPDGEAEIVHPHTKTGVDIILAGKLATREEFEPFFKKSLSLNESSAKPLEKFKDEHLED